MKPLASLFSDFNFAEPLFLYLLVPLAVLFIVWLLAVLIGFISRPEKTYGSKYPFIGKIKLWGIVLFSLIFMVIALARPSISGARIKPARGDIEAVVLFDNSFSMKADDLKPSRLEIAKREILGLESLLKEGDKIGLFTFGKSSNRKFYLTDDFGTFFDQVSRVVFPKNLTGDETIFFTDFAGALEHVYQSLDRQDVAGEGFSRDQLKRYKPKKKTNRIVLVFSDGEDQFLNLKPQNQEEAEAKAKYVKKLSNVLAEYRKRGLKIYPVGIGTRNGVAFLSLLRGYKKGVDYSEELEKEWAGFVTRLDRARLAALAKATGTDLSGFDWTVENIQGNARDYLERVLDSNRKPLFGFTESENNQPLWQYCLLIAVGFLAVGIMTYPHRGCLRKEST